MNVNIIWEYRTAKKQEISLTTTESIPAHKALIFAQDFERTGRIKDIYFEDDNNTRWTKKELEKYVKGVETEPHNLVAYFDGGYDVESKKAGLGVVLYFSQNGKRFRIRKNELFDQLESNNEAEYAALWLLLLEIERLGVKHLPVTFLGDSQVVINQISGEWPVFESEFEKWLDRIEDKMKELGIKPKYEAIGRKENREADQLASQALSETFVESQLELDD